MVDDEWVKKKASEIDAYWKTVLKDASCAYVRRDGNAYIFKLHLNNWHSMNAVLVDVFEREPWRIACDWVSRLMVGHWKQSNMEWVEHDTKLLSECNENAD